MTDTKHKNIAAALAAAQSQMGKALKDSTNPHFGKSYADLSSVVGACMPALNANGIAVVQPFTDDESGRYITTMFLHSDSGDTLECRVPLIVNKNDMQGFGSAATYARRYGLMAMAGIAPEDDDGNAAASAPPKEPTGPSAKAINDAKNALLAAASLDDLKAVFVAMPHDIKSQHSVINAKDARKAELELAPADDMNGDDIPDFPPAPEGGA